MKKKLVMSIMLIIATAICIAGCRNGATSSVNRPTIVATPSEVVAKATPATTASTTPPTTAAVKAAVATKSTSSAIYEDNSDDFNGDDDHSTVIADSSINDGDDCDSSPAFNLPEKLELDSKPAPTKAPELATIPAPTKAPELATIPAPTRAPYTLNKWGRVTTSTEAVTSTELFPIEKGVFVLILSEQDTEITIAWYGDTATIPRNSVHILENITPEYEEKILQGCTAGVIEP